MAAIMDLFAAEFDDFAKDCDKNYLRASFDDGRYPPRIQVTQTLPPLYAQAEEGQTGKVRETRITVVGDVDCNVSIYGEVTMTKKDLNNLIGKTRFHAREEGTGSGGCPLNARPGSPATL